MDHMNAKSDLWTILLPLPSSTSFGMMESQVSGHSFGGVSWLHLRMKETSPLILQFGPHLRLYIVGPERDYPIRIVEGDHPSDSFLYPGYGDLFSLFSRIAKAIKQDYHWADGTIRRRPDFVHELLQRIILNFVVENKHAPVMDKKKSDRNRGPFVCQGRPIYQLQRPILAVPGRSRYRLLVRVASEN
jgi:hypothetical protein